MTTQLYLDILQGIINQLRLNPKSRQGITLDVWSLELIILKETQVIQLDRQLTRLSRIDVIFRPVHPLGNLSTNHTERESAQHDSQQHYPQDLSHSNPILIKP